MRLDTAPGQRILPPERGATTAAIQRGSPAPTATDAPRPVYYLAPRRWVLAAVMSPHEWHELRAQVIAASPGTTRCSCPAGCPATVLDEQWTSVPELHVKRFVGAALRCPGCHWLGDQSRRIQTWLALKARRRAEPHEKQHIRDCLGWTRKQVKALRDRDLADHAARLADLVRIETAAQTGEASVRPWQVDAGALRQYGYSDDEIRSLEMRMMDIAWEQIAHSNRPDTARNSRLDE